MYLPHPLLSAAGRRLEYSAFLPGESIAAYLERRGIRFGSQPVRLWLNGQVIPADEWPLTFPRDGDLILIRARVGDSNLLRSVLQIAVVVAAIYIAGPKGLALSGWAAAGTQAAIIIGGNMLINAVLPLPTPQLNPAGRQDSPSPTYALTGGSNRARPYGPLPLPMGSNRMFPDLGAQPFTEFDGDDQFLCQIFNFGLKNVRLSDFRIGNTPVKDFEGVTIEISDVTGALTLFSGNVDTIVGGALTHAAGWIEKTSSPEAKVLVVELTGLLYRIAADGGVVEHTVDLKAEYRKVGETEWRPFVPGTQTVYHTHYWSAGRYEALGTVNDEPVFGWVQVAYGSTEPGEHTEGEIHSVVPTSWEGDDIDFGYTAVWRYRPYSEINGGVPGSELADDAPEEGFPEHLPSRTLASASRKPLRITWRRRVTKGQYEVRVRRVTEDDTDVRVVSDIVWAQLRTYQPDNADYTGQKRVAVRIKASGQLQGTLDQLSALASAHTRVRTDDGWRTMATSNPAWWLLDFYRGQFVNGRLAYGCGLPDSRIKISEIRAFAAWCDAKQLTFNGIFDQEMTCFDAANAIARCGRGSVSTASGKFGVTWDAPDQPVVAVFGMGNIKLDTFRVQWVSEKLADEIELTFRNPDLNWQQDSVRAKVPGVVTPVRTASLPLFGCADKDMAGREVNLIAAAQRYRRRFVTLETDMEGRVASRGDVVLVSHALFAMQTVSAWGRSGRLVTGTTTVLELDEPVPFTPATPYYCAVRFPDGTLHIRAVEAEVGETAVITLTEALPSAPNLDANGHPPLDYLWFFGLDATGPGKKMKVHDANPVAEDVIQFTLVDETRDYYDTEDGEYTYVPPGGPGTLAPALSNLEIAEELVRAGNALQAKLTLTWDVSGSYARADIRAGVNGAPLEDRGSTPGRRFEFTVPATGEVTVQVTGVHPLFGVIKTSTLTAVHVLTALAKRPSDVPWFAIDGDILTWGDVPDLDKAGFRIKFNYGTRRSFGDATPMHAGLLTSSPFRMRPRPTGRVTIMIVAADTLGVGNSDPAHESKTPAFIVTDLGDPIAANLVETIDLEAQNFPGSIVNGARAGTDILAADASDLMWNPNPNAAMWSLASSPMWSAQLWHDMYYTTQINVSQAGSGARMTLEHAIEGEAYVIEYRRNGPGPMWTDDDELMWGAAGDLMWTPPPGDFPNTNMWTDDANPMWAADDSQRMWNSLQGGYEVWPGEIMVVNEPYDIRVSTAFGPTRGKIDHLAFTVDMPDVIERLDDIVILAAGTRLPIAKAYREIKNVSLTLQDDGGTAVSVKTYDKNATLGPLVKAANAAGTFVDASIDATIQGY